MDRPTFNYRGDSAPFLFATLDGTIGAWSPAVESQRDIAVNNSASGSMFTGLAITNHPSGNLLYAADHANNIVDVYDGNFNLVNSFTDPTLPAGLCPLRHPGHQRLGLRILCQSHERLRWLIDIFQEDGTLVKQLVQGPPLNQPWGFAVAPKNFGPLSNTLLVVEQHEIGEPSTALISKPASSWGRSKTRTARISSSTSSGVLSSVEARQPTVGRINFSSPPVRTTTWRAPSV